MDKVKVFTDLREEFKLLTYENHDQLKKLSLRFRTLVGRIVDDNSAYLSEFSKIRYNPIAFTTSTPSSTFEKSWNNGKANAINIIDALIEDIKLFDTIDNVKSEDSLNKFDVDFSKVFIVHGHDDGAKETVARFVDKLGFKAVILHEQVDSGATIIEKLEKHTDVGFAIVLYTECDIGGVKSKPEDLKPRARQNVIFEHGLLIGKIGRANVVALVKGDVEIPNDISGVVYKPMDTGGAWKYSIAKEMKSSGYDVDMNKID
ncbi:TIR domain-containing protein [Psychrobacter immobilis]|uniref:TIR domain-containing protein n=1 Tax=Psychrobacter immobilis TaxID=498 RepID=UPI003FD0FE15